jgi:hypothetical protein
MDVSDQTLDFLTLMRSASSDMADHGCHRQNSSRDNRIEMDSTDGWNFEYILLCHSNVFIIFMFAVFESTVPQNLFVGYIMALQEL